MARPRQALLSRERIVAEATRVLDAEGLDALSTRRLARELQVQAPSLYNHFGTKEEILDAVAESIIAQVDISMFGTRPWPEALMAWARGYRAALAAHPNAVPFLARGPARRPAALRLADAVYGALVDAGWPPSYATRIGATMRYFVAGSALGSFALGFVDDPDVYAADYPHLSGAHRLREHRDQVDEGAFELGLTTLVAGFTTLYDDVVPSRKVIGMRTFPSIDALREAEGADLGHSAWRVVDQARVDAFAEATERPAVDPRGPGARGPGSVRLHHRARLPRPVAAAVAGGGDLPGGRRADGGELRAQPGPLPRTAADGLVGAGGGAAAVGRGRSRAGCTWSTRSRSSGRGRTSPAASPRRSPASTRDPGQARGPPAT